jgi:hypothetical protein
VKPIALYYLSVLDDIRATARALGYAVGLHGTLNRDLDLIACPWCDDAKPADDLATALAVLVGGKWHATEVSEKPHGRRAYLIRTDPLYRKPDMTEMVVPLIDLSVMPRESPGG